MGFFQDLYKGITSDPERTAINLVGGPIFGTAVNKIRDNNKRNAELGQGTTERITGSEEENIQAFLDALSNAQGFVNDAKDNSINVLDDAKAAQYGFLNRELQNIGKREQDLGSYFKKEINQDYLSSPTAQNTLTKLREQLRENNQSIEGNALKTGATFEQKLAQKQAGQENYNNTVSNLAAQGDQRKDQLNSQYQYSLNNLLGAKNQIGSELSNVAGNTGRSISDIYQNTGGNLANLETGAAGNVAGQRNLTTGLVTGNNQFQQGSLQQSNQNIINALTQLLNLGAKVAA